MKKLSVALIVAALLAGTSSARADWSSDLQAAINSGNYGEINVIAANNPNEQGAIALALLTAAQNDIATHPDSSVKLFSLAAPFTEQIPAGQVPGAIAIVNHMLTLADNPGFQKGNPRGANAIFTAALAMSSGPNFVVGAPNLHNVALADASDFIDHNPDAKDKGLEDQVNLALQVGFPPVVGPHGFLTPSPE